MWISPGTSWASLAAAALLCLRTASAVTISDINGDAFISPLKGQAVTNVTGLVTAKGPSGIWIRSPTASESVGSDSIYVFSSSVGANLTVGDEIRLDATVAEYRSSSAYLYLTELSSPKNVVRISSGNAVEPVFVGGVRSPPTEQYSSLDGGDVFAVPNNESQISVVNPTLQPELYGMDFWESLCGELVTIEAPVALAKPNSYGEVWVRGNWTVTGLNGRGGLTMTDADANPEAIMIGDALDSTTHPTTIKLGDTLSDITGVVTYAFGSYYLLPTTALAVLASPPPPLPPPTTLASTNSCSGLTFASYNVANLWANSSHLPTIASHIAVHLRSPDLLFLQEIQDDSGPATSDGITTSNRTLAALVASIASHGGPAYAFASIDPAFPDADGGQPGANIRPAYLYNPARLALLNPNPGNATQATVPLSPSTLSFNPGRVDPANAAAWTDSRKPLAAVWRTLDGDGEEGEGRLWTVNVHWASKGGSSTLAGDARAPANGGVGVRRAQAEATAGFVADVLAVDPLASVVVAGDFNEFAFVEPVVRFVEGSGALRDADVVAGVGEVERYTYLYDGNCQQLDHVFVSEAVAGKGVEFEHVHVNTWAGAEGMASDHDPSVGRVNVCV
ncbi:endonuclease exonuclease phosphatase family protein [Diplodia corticola]|uniref:Endonuclease exonuclease phosphatase family protein n=1 Tax=Diplodia corticola TaxID=236234 RepID=A0A1J9RAN0_9PEZI|nr:endonuclease exonuclease phosphatase family protein [Diplodia corticola]OJD29475.1 endonuclease exonuclease phosphatase family protein [Diplodia corticola]